MEGRSRTRPPLRSRDANSVVASSPHPETEKPKGFSVMYDTPRSHRSISPATSCSSFGRASDQVPIAAAAAAALAS